MATVRPTGPAAEGIRPRVATAPTGRRRRPSGEPPPLPRRLEASTRALAAVVVLVVALELALAAPPLRVAITAVDLAVLEVVEALRVDAAMQPVADVLQVAPAWAGRAVFWGTVVVLVLLRRVYHLITLLALVLLVSLVGTGLAVLQGRMRPAGIVLEGEWSGYSHPSVPVAQLAVVLVGALCTLVPPGAWRRRATAFAFGLLALLCLARLWLGTDHPSDLVAAVGLGWALPLVVFRTALPEEAFPVSYRDGNRAHVDLGGARGPAIDQALHQQLGLRVVRLAPFGLGGSAGSMPLRVDVQGEDGHERTLFGKLYTVTHLQSDRWYKTARMVLYGRLEDEKPFSTVRRLVEYEDHMLRLLRDAGLPVPAPHGLVEITPEREYLVLMEFFAGAKEIGDVQLSDAEIDDGLRIVHRLWEAGVAHRDLKPSNLLVREGRVLLIDVAFATVRPTPWRQAVDLADMLLTLALSSSAERVYARALLQFAPDDLAEALAACRGVTVPTQLRARLKADGRDLVGQFRELAPARPPVRVQLWSLRRVLVTSAVAAGAALAAVGLLAYARVADLL